MDANRLGRLFKGEEYDIDIKIPYSGETFNSFELQFFTDSASTFTVPFPQLSVEGDIIHANIQENDFDLLADGVLRYYIDYIVNDVETILSTNTMHYLKTHDGYSGKTAEDIYNEGYTSGSTDGYNSGYSDGENDQKEKLVTTAITVNGIYTSEDGFSSVEVNVAQSGHTDAEIEEAYESGYTQGYTSGNTDGYDSGYTEGYTSGTTDGYDDGFTDGHTSGMTEQKSLLVSTAITENGIYRREDGYSEINVNVQCSGGTCTMQSKDFTISANGTTTITPDTGYDGITGGTISVNVPSAGTTNLEKTININSNGNYEISTTIEHTFNYSFPNSKTCTFTLTGEWPDGKYYIGDVIPEHGGGYIEIYVYDGGFVYDDDEWDRNVGRPYFTAEGTSALTVNVDFESSFNSIEFDETPDEYAEDGSYILGGINFKVNVPQSGHTEQEIEEAYNSGYTAGYTSGNTDGYEDGHSDGYDIGYSDGFTYGYASGSTDGYNEGYSSGHTDGFDAGYTSGSTDGYNDGFSEGHTSGMTDGYESGYTAGVDAQKELMEELYVNTNGTYTSENGYSTVHVNVTPDGNDFYFLATSSNSSFSIPEGTKYSTDKINWTEGPATIRLSSGQKAYVRTTAQDGSWPSGKRFATSGGTFDIGGSLETLLCGPSGGTITTSVEGIFLGCQHIVDASKLDLIQIMIDNGYARAFQGCTSLKKLPELPNPGGDSYYYDTFAGCTSLRYACEELPGTIYYSGVNYTISYEHVYQGMFRNCASLEVAPKLPSLKATDYCYYGMFEGCTSLVKAPELNASRIGYSSYEEMFKGCTSLVLPPSNLPAGILYTSCYEGMFNGCTSLVKTPTRVISSTGGMDYKVKPYCYQKMFAGCTSLVTNDFNFSEGTFEDGPRCFYGMFSGCTSLQKIEFNTSLYDNAQDCCDYMFDGCENLIDIKIITCDWDTNNSTNWVRGIASGGTFTKWQGFSMPFGDDAIPSGWTVNNIE